MILARLPLSTAFNCQMPDRSGNIFAEQGLVEYAIDRCGKPHPAFRIRNYKKITAALFPEGKLLSQ